MRHVRIPGVTPMGMAGTFARPLLGWALCIEWTMHHLADSFESRVEQWFIEPG